LLTALRFFTSLAILLWGGSMVMLGMFRGEFLWCAIGTAVAGVGIPLLGSHPWAAPLLYPGRGPIEGPGAER
jgi:hypothetical protein